jgi:hypothetical protein
MIRLVETLEGLTSWLNDAADSANGFFLGSYRIATTPEPNSSRLTSLKSTRFDSPANNVGPRPASLGRTSNSVLIDQSQLRQRERGASRLPRTGPYPTPA